MPGQHEKPVPNPPVFDIMMSIVFWLLLLADDLLKPGRGHSRSWKAFAGPQNCSISSSGSGNSSNGSSLPGCKRILVRSQSRRRLCVQTAAASQQQRIHFVAVHAATMPARHTHHAACACADAAC